MILRNILFTIYVAYYVIYNNIFVLFIFRLKIGNEFYVFFFWRTLVFKFLFYKTYILFL